MTIGSLLYFGAVAVWSALVAYFILEKVAPVKAKAPHPEPVLQAVMPSPLPSATDAGRIAVPAVFAPPAPPHTSGTFDPSQGFRSFQTGGELSVDDIVKGLSRN